MSEMLYLLQVAIIGGTLFIFVRNAALILRLQVIVWMIGVAAIMFRFGITDQLNFYSNDQRFYSGIVTQLSSLELTLDLDWWISSSKLPFTLPAALLAALGFAPSLALKAVALLCLLALTQLVLISVSQLTNLRTVGAVFLTACGGIGVFYSLLALRETMMMLFVSQFVITRRPATRLASIAMLLLLRPHLAAALIAAAIINAIWTQLRWNKQESIFTLLPLASLGALTGYFLYSLGVERAVGVQNVFGYQWGVSSITRIASNFLGIQFLTARSESVEFAISSLLILRVLLSETILIPTLFTLALFIYPRRVTSTSRLMLLAFSIYVGLVTNTDFNSFRQNIPLMPAMGLVIVTTLPILQSKLLTSSS